MMHAPVNPIDNGKGCALQLVIKPARDETANDRFAMSFALQCPECRGAAGPVPREGFVQPLNDVTALAKHAQPRLRIGGQTQTAGPAGSVKPSRSSVRIRPIRISRN